jgi:predicted RNA methylase
METETNTLKDGTIITGFKNDLITNGLRIRKDYYENIMLEFIRKNIPKGVMVDVGANIGNHTIYLAKYCATNVIAYEPFPDTFKLLEQNINQNNQENNIEALRCGLSDSAKELKCQASKEMLE